MLNVSTRLFVQTGENGAIAGFIITGVAPKKVLLRGIGPSLKGLSPVLADPVLELHGPDGSLIVRNDNWKDLQRAAIQATGLAPTDDAESAIIADLRPGAYTAILNGKNETVGIGLIEMYDLEPASDSTMANISTRGLVQTGNNVLIGGFILGDGKADDTLIIRGIGPSLAGVPGTLADPVLSLYETDGTVLASDDNWRDDPAQAAEIMSSGLAPRSDLEAAISIGLPPGAYTAVITGKDGGTGVALVEVYHLR